MENKAQELGTAPIKKLLAKLSLPAFTGMLVMATYNLVDTIFVGQGVGSLGIGGLTIAFPIQMIISSFAMAIGVGGASLVSRSLGEGDREKATYGGGNVLGTAFGAGIIMAATGYIFLDPLLLLFGATDDIFPFAKDYVGIIVLSTPFMSIAMAGNNIMRAEGKAKMAMWTMIIASAINLIFDPIFIFVLDMGIKGAAYATVLAHIAAASYMIQYFYFKRSELDIRFKHLIPKKPIIKEIAAIGSSSFSRQASGSIVATVLNHSLGHYGGDLAIAAYGMIGRVAMFTFMPMIGVAQGFQPVAGFNFGAGKIDRVMSAIKYSIAACLAAGIVGFTILMIFPEYIYMVFTTDQELLNITVRATRQLVLMFPIIGIQLLGAVLFQALGKAWPALFLALSRQILFFIPLILILPKFMGLDGIWYAFPAADLLSTSITVAFILRELKKLRHANLTNKKQSEDIKST